MRYLVAPNAFKGSVTAAEAAELIGGELEKVWGSKVVTQPIADGGDGTCELLIDSLGMEKVSMWTLDAVGRPILGYFGWDSRGKKAYLDISTASGIGVLGEYQRDPYLASTFGTGLLIKKATQIGAEEIVLGLGGSATIDLGIGILQALGFLFLDQSGREIPSFCPDFLSKILHIQKNTSVPKVRFTMLCDVRNPFLGASGAVSVFGPQKGLVENKLASFQLQCEKVLALLIDKSRKGWEDQPGFGAAGGVAMGLSFFFETQIKFGAPYFFGLVEMGEKVDWADWIITGEGRYDSQSDQGKASHELLAMAKSKGKKTVLVTSGDGGRDAGFDLILELPALDFSEMDYRNKAQKNLLDVLRTAIAEGQFS